jgi:hypothetical protein
LSQRCRQTIGQEELALGPDRVEKFLTVHGQELSPTNYAVCQELLRRFSEQSGEEAGEHFTPREVIRLMVELLDLPFVAPHPHVGQPAQQRIYGCGSAAENCDGVGQAEFRQVCHVCLDACPATLGGVFETLPADRLVGACSLPTARLQFAERDR